MVVLQWLRYVILEIATVNAIEELSHKWKHFLHICTDLTSECPHVHISEDS